MQLVIMTTTFDSLEWGGDGITKSIILGSPNLTPSFRDGNIENFIASIFDIQICGSKSGIHEIKI